LVLDLLRVTPEPSAARVQALVEVGALFGFNGSAVRVAITRLVQSRMVESDERGCYRLAPGTSRFNRWVENWRLGEARMRPWNRGWLAVGGTKTSDRAALRRSQRALARLGFARGFAGLYLRPDNLATPIDDTRRLLEDFGLSADAEVFVASQFTKELNDRFERTLWPTKKLRERQKKAIRDLRRSEKRIASTARLEAVVETFVLGGTAIRLLALDPLLPEEIMPGDDRRELTELMLRYDESGRAIWKSFAEAYDEKRSSLQN
jgi:phenylacetic acid degradation operon negative regulatory protein